MNSYVSLGTLKAELGKTGTADDAVLLRLLNRASREIDVLGEWPHFYPETATRLFCGHGRDRVDVGALISATTVKVDLDRDGTFETTLTVTTDYILGPTNEEAGRPRYTFIRLNPLSTVLTQFPMWEDSIQVVGVFGFSNETDPSGTLGAAITDVAATSITMTAGHGLTGGETIIIGTERLYVSAVATNTLTVVRGVNGTTAATALNNAAVRVQRYHDNVEAACVLRAADNYRGTQSGYGRVSESEFGGYQSNSSYAQFRGLVRDVARRPIGAY